MNTLPVSSHSSLSSRDMYLSWHRAASTISENESTSKETVQELYRDFYSDEPFVRVTETPPQTKQTTGSNLCLVYPTVDEQAGRLVVVSCIDNLGKGAAGQAVQNMNVMFGLEEDEGLQGLALYP